MVFLNGLTAKLDPTKIRVTEGDLPVGDWIFNGHAMVFTPPASTDENEPAPEKIIVPLQNKVKVTPVKAEEFGIIRQFGADMSPLAGALAGATLFNGLFGVMTGFAAGSLLSRNLASFTCELEDGRHFTALAEIKIFKRLCAIAKNERQASASADRG